MGEILDLLKSEGYKFGDLQVLRYDPKRPDVFPPPFLSKLYTLAQNSGRRSKLGILPQIFCGMQDISHDTIVAYLTNRPLVILVRWLSPAQFDPLGFAFTCSISMGSEKQAILGYGFFLPAWGKPEVLPLTILGLAYFFRELGLLALHGTRYASNEKSARLIKQVGFKDVGRVPRWMLDREGKLTDMIVSSLMVEDFEEIALTLLEGIAKNGQGIIQSGAVSASHHRLTE